MLTSPEANAEPSGPPSGLRITLSTAALLVVFAAILFLSAGRADWPTAWFYLAIMTANVLANFAYLRARNPELIAARSRFGKGTKTWDKIWMALFGPLFVSVYVVAGLDAGRFGWSTMPLSLWPLGLALFLPGSALFTWSMGVNPFFEKTVRIQTERGHRVIDTGPYRFVRHPGYTGFLGWILSAPMLLGSWWAFLPAAIALAGVVVRTALEDRTLRAELPGYTDYARRVRFRLIPGVW